MRHGIETGESLTSSPAFIELLEYDDRLDRSFFTFCTSVDGHIRFYFGRVSCLLLEMLFRLCLSFAVYALLPLYQILYCVLCLRVAAKLFAPFFADILHARTQRVAIDCAAQQRCISPPSRSERSSHGQEVRFLERLVRLARLPVTHSVHDTPLSGHGRMRGEPTAARCVPTEEGLH